MKSHIILVLSILLQEGIKVSCRMNILLRSRGEKKKRLLLAQKQLQIQEKFQAGC